MALVAVRHLQLRSLHQLILDLETHVQQLLGSRHFPLR